MSGTLYYGDNLDIMENRIKKESVDLIYLDPPFNSKRNYNLLYKTMTGKPVEESVEAFCDTWGMDSEKEQEIEAMPKLLHEFGVEDYYIKFWETCILSLKDVQPTLLSYLLFMIKRILFMHKILRNTGSIYLHCDPTASHYIKIMMDGIFGHNNFRNEIIWHYQTGGASKRWFSKKHDVIFWYSKNERLYNFYPEQVMVKRTDEVLRRINSGIEGATRATTEMKLPMDVWTDIQALNPMSKERLGYPTQKPIELLDRIIKSSCPEGGVVFDPFCGCGTTIYSAIKNNRHWIGCDIAILSIKIIKEQLEHVYTLKESRYGGAGDFEVSGIPATLEQAMKLYKDNMFQFEHWIVEHLGGFPVSKKHDKNISGKLYFETSSGLASVIISVLAFNNTDVDTLKSMLAEMNFNKEGVIACFVINGEVPKEFKSTIKRAGVYTYNNNSYDRLQFLSIKEIMEDGKGIDMPENVGPIGIKKALKNTKAQKELELE